MARRCVAGRPVPVLHLLRRVPGHRPAGRRRRGMAAGAADAAASGAGAWRRLAGRRGAGGRGLFAAVPARPGRRRRPAGFRYRHLQRGARKLCFVPAVQPALGLDLGARWRRAPPLAGCRGVGPGGVGGTHTDRAVDVGVRRRRARVGRRVDRQPRLDLPVAAAPAALSGIAGAGAVRRPDPVVGRAAGGDRVRPPGATRRAVATSVAAGRCDAAAPWRRVRERAHGTAHASPGPAGLPLARHRCRRR